MNVPVAAASVVAALVFEYVLVLEADDTVDVGMMMKGVQV